MFLFTRPGRTRRCSIGCTLLVLVLPVLLAACSDSAERERAHMARGQEYSATGDYEKARVEFKNAVKIDPADAAARMALAQTLERLGNFRAAAGHYLRIIEDRPDHPGSRVRMGRIYLLAKQPKKALELADAAVKIAPHLPAAYALRGSAHLALGDAKAAEADAKAALAEGPDDIDAVQFAAGLAAHEGKLDQAIALVEPAVAAHPKNGSLRLIEADLLAKAGRHDAAVKSLQALVRISPPSLELAPRLRLAAYLARLGRHDEAEAALHDAIKRFPDDPAPVLALAQFLTTARGPGQAERLLLAAVAEHDDPAPFEKALVRLYKRTGQSDKMEAMLQRMIDEHGTTAPGLEARTALAEVRAENGKVDEARALVAEVLKENALDKAALTLSAKLALLPGGDVTRAIGDLRTVLRDDPGAIEAIWLLGVAYQRNHELKAAEKQFRHALEVSPAALSPRLDLAQLLATQGDADGAKAVIEAGLTRNPDSVPLLTVRGRTEARDRDWNALASTAARLEKLAPDKAIGHYLAGLAARSAGDLQAAAQAFERAAELAPHNADALSAMVRSLVDEGRADAALENLKATGKDGVEDPTVLRLRGSLLRGLGRLEESAAALRRAVELAPAVPGSQRELALTLEAQGKKAQALAILEKALPATGDSLLILVELGRLYDRLGRAEDAIALYEGYLKRHPDSRPATNNLAMLLATRRSDRASLDRAVKLAERFRGSGSPAYLDTLGWVHHQRGEAASAISILENVVALSPNVPTFQYHLGAALIGGGQIERGRDHLERSLRSDTAFPERDQAVAMLESLPRR